MTTAQTIPVPPDPREPHEFGRDDDQPSYAGGYCRCGWVREARVHQVALSSRSEADDAGEPLPADVLTGDEQLSLPPGCKCGYALSHADGLWHVISRDRCPMHAQVGISGGS